MKAFKHLFTNLLTVISIVMALLMIFVGYSDRINPEDHPVLACAGMIFPFFIIINLGFLVAWILIQWRKVWIPFVAFIVCYPPIHTYFPLHGSGKVPEGCIKVLSYNVCGYKGNEANPACFDSIINYLKQQKADILCLQEDNKSKTDSVKALYRYSDTIFINSNPPLASFLSIYSRFPIIKKERIDMESRGNGAAAFYLKIGKQKVIVINTHLESFHLSFVDKANYQQALEGDLDSETVKAETRSLLKKVSEAMALRAPQADAVHEYIEDHMDYPIIVCGDFNDTPISYVRHTIAQGLTDCFAATGTGMGVSYNKKGFRFRIDHILCSDDFRPYSCKVDESTKESDHYPIMCWLELDGYFNK